MLEFLSAYLDAYATPGQRELYLRACNVLVECGIRDHVFALEQDLAVAEQLDSDIFFSSTNGILLPYYRNALAEFGIVVNDDASLHILTDMLEAVHRLDNYDDKEAINALTADIDGPEAALADILTLTGALSADEYLLAIESVNPDLLRKLEQMTRVDVIPSDTASQETITRSSKRLKKFMVISVSQEPTEPLMVVIDLQNGVRLASPLKILIEPRRAHLETLSPYQLAKELLGYVLASDTPDAEIKTAIKHELDLIHLDVDKITAVDVVLSRYLPQVTHA